MTGASSSSGRTDSGVEGTIGGTTEGGDAEMARAAKAGLPLE